MEPVSFPIVHRFQVHPPSAAEASRIPGGRGPPRPSFPAAQQSFASQDQDSPRTSSFTRPQLSKKPFRPERPGEFKKLPGDDGDNPNESKKPKSRPKFSGFLGNRKFADEVESATPSQLKVTRRPAGTDIRQETPTLEAGKAEPMGSRRLDASINPVVTRKRLLVTTEGRPAARRGERKQEEPEEREPRGRTLQVTPARAGRKLGGGRSSTQPSSPQQTSGRAQTAVAAGQENPRPPARRPTQAPPAPPVQSIKDDTPKIRVEEKARAAPANVQKPEAVTESESPAGAEEPSDTVDSIIDALQQAATKSISPEQSPAAEENHVGEASQPEAVVEKVPETQAEAVEKTEAETEADTAEPAKTPANTAFSPPEIVVKTPEEPKVANPTVEKPADTNEEPTQERAGSSRTRSSARGQPSGADASPNQTQSRSGEQTRGRNRASSRGQTRETANQAAVRDASNTARQSQVRGRSRTESQPQTVDEAAPPRTSRTRG